MTESLQVCVLGRSLLGEPFELLGVGALKHMLRYLLLQALAIVLRLQSAFSQTLRPGLQANTSVPDFATGT